MSTLHRWWSNALSAACTVECRCSPSRCTHQPNLAVPSRRKELWRAGARVSCPVLVLEQGWPLAVVPVNGPSVFVPCVTVARRCRRLSGHGKQSHHLTSPSHQRPRLGPFSSSPCFTVTQVGDRVALALSSPPGTGGYCCSARCKSSLVYQICVLGRENNPLHTASVRALPTRAKRKPDVDIQSIGNLPESVSRNSQGSPSQFALPARQPTRPKPSQSNGGAGLQFQVDGPFLHPPIRAPRNGTHYGMIFKTPSNFPSHARPQMNRNLQR